MAICNFLEEVCDDFAILLSDGYVQVWSMHSSNLMLGCKLFKMLTILLGVSISVFQLRKQSSKNLRQLRVNSSCICLPYVSPIMSYSLISR